VLCWIK